jgi:RimJ/RimL family protein N-acetyltransferase
MPDESAVVTLSDGVVTLRPWSRDDARFMAEAHADPAIRRYNGEHDRQGHPAPPPTITDAEADIEQFALNWRAFAATGTPSGVAFAILDTASGKLAGCCGVDDWSPEDVAQFGYWIAPEARGHGYATRAVVLLTRWLFDVGAARVFLTIVAGNEDSVAVARRAGFVHEGTMRAHGVWQGERCDVMWFAALPLEWAMPSASVTRRTAANPPPLSSAASRTVSHRRDSTSARLRARWVGLRIRPPFRWSAGSAGARGRRRCGSGAAPGTASPG